MLTERCVLEQVEASDRLWGADLHACTPVLVIYLVCLCVHARVRLYACKLLACGLILFCGLSGVTVRSALGGLICHSLVRSWVFQVSQSGLDEMYTCLRPCALPTMLHMSRIQLDAHYTPQ